MTWLTNLTSSLTNEVSHRFSLHLLLSIQSEGAKSTRVKGPGIMTCTAIYLGHKNAIQHSNRVRDILSHSFDLLFTRHFDFSDQDTFEQQNLSEMQADFLFGFGPLIVKPLLLSSIRVAAINFHPAPPKWPGRGSCSMAILSSDTEFGATAHTMYSKIDAGPILKVVRFQIARDEDASTLRSHAFEHIPELVRLVVEDLKHNCWQPILSTEKMGEICYKKSRRSPKASTK